MVAFTFPLSASLYYLSKEASPPTSASTGKVHNSCSRSLSLRSVAMGGTLHKLNKWKGDLKRRISCLSRSLKHVQGWFCKTRDPILPEWIGQKESFTFSFTTKTFQNQQVPKVRKAELTRSESPKYQNTKYFRAPTLSRSDRPASLAPLGSAGARSPSLGRRQLLLHVPDGVSGDLDLGAEGRFWTWELRAVFQVQQMSWSLCPRSGPGIPWAFSSGVFTTLSTWVHGSI